MIGVLWRYESMWDLKVKVNTLIAVYSSIKPQSMQSLMFIHYSKPGLFRSHYLACALGKFIKNKGTNKTKTKKNQKQFLLN